MSLDPALRSRIDTLLADNRIVLFMKGQPQAPQCGFSATAVGALNSLGIDDKHVDVLADPEIRDAIKLYGDWPTIPQLYIGGDVLNLDAGLEAIDALPKDTALAFLCHHGNRSAQAAEHFRQQGFREVYNIAGGIDAWADVEQGVAKY